MPAEPTENPIATAHDACCCECAGVPGARYMHPGALFMRPDTVAQAIADHYRVSKAELLSRDAAGKSATCLPASQANAKPARPADLWQGVSLGSVWPVASHADRSDACLAASHESNCRVAYCHGSACPSSPRDSLHAAVACSLPYAVWTVSLPLILYED